MTDQIAADALSELIVERKDFKRAFADLEKAVAQSFLGIATQPSLEGVEARHLLRGA
ncbi:hypothetical protein [Agromyces bauzanensis]|uniref:Uncharacterized protein n=1 Tax=Agromyces bauzanensis TaxID=1308924 RepID=A0A917UXB6_9MICO|nr:hypothetical protein [Agromyces bauzanensis]GGJ92759.1 hypothetical protein GCM10011372_34120 [Agromyces bauzanensis]